MIYDALTARAARPALDPVYLREWDHLLQLTPKEESRIPAHTERIIIGGKRHGVLLQTCSGTDTHGCVAYGTKLSVVRVFETTGWVN